ncbi:hypothetical protein Tco_0043873, partial [Tanacetum coccineum]
MDKDVGLICMLNLFLIFNNADTDAEVKGWMWMLFTSFTSRRTRHKNKDVVHLVLTEELTLEHVVVTPVDDPVIDSNHMFNVVRDNHHQLRSITMKSFLKEILMLQ